MGRICLGASISGHLFGDSDGDKKYNPAKDSPGPNRIVRLRVSGKEIANVYTDESSFYEFCGLTAGTYEVTRDYPKGYQMANPTVPGTNVIVVKLADKQAVTVDVGSMVVSADDNSSSSSSNSSNSSASSASSESNGGNIPAGVMGLEKGVCSLSSIFSLAGIQSPYGKVSALDLVRKWGVKHTREWEGCDYRIDSSAKKSDYDYLRHMKAAGLKTFVCFATQNWNRGEPTKASDTRDCFNRTLDLAGDCIDFWEIGNEPNSSGYWPSQNPSKFVDLVGNPAYEVLHAAGKQIVSASVTYDVSFVQKLLSAGLVMDYVGFHPYRETASALKSLMASLVAVTGSRKIALTEWNTFLGSYYRANFQPKSSLSKFPALSAGTIVQRQIDSWNVLKAIPQVSHAAYFISHSPKASDGTMWKHTTGPLELVDTYAMKTTPFSDDFFAKV